MKQLFLLILHSFLLHYVIAYSYYETNDEYSLARDTREAEMYGESTRYRREAEFDEESMGDGESTDEESGSSSVYDFLYKRMKQEAEEVTRKRKRPTPTIYTIPGPQEPLPGRSHMGDYWPVFPFQNQFSGGLDLDPSISRHIGGDLNLAVPSWGMLDIYGRFFNRIHDTTTKFGYMNYPVNMLDLEKEDFVKLMSDPSLQHNRNNQPRLPLGKFAKSYVPLSCKPPMCNPYHQSFGFGMEHDYGGRDGVEGDIDVPIPISKGVAYRLPIAGKIYHAYDNITVSYGQNLAPIDPYSSLFDYQKYRDPRLAIPRSKREASESAKVWQSEPETKTFGDHVKFGAAPKPKIFKTKISKPASTKFDKIDPTDTQYVTMTRQEYYDTIGAHYPERPAYSPLNSPYLNTPFKASLGNIDYVSRNQNPYSQYMYSQYDNVWQDQVYNLPKSRRRVRRYVPQYVYNYPMFY